MTTDQTVYVLVIEHKHGANVSVHRTKVGADGALASYCDEWWHDLGLEGTAPEDNNQLIETYFTNIEDESYEIFTVRVED